MCIFARPLPVTKVNEQSVHTISGGAGVELLRKPTQTCEPHRDIDLAGAVEHMDVAVFKIAIETHDTVVNGATPQLQKWHVSASSARSTQRLPLCCGLRVLRG